MAHVKVAFIGAGSFVFGPSVLHQAIDDHHLGGMDLSLVDVDGEMVELMAGVGRRMAREAGLDMAIRAGTECHGALDGADFVICSAARELRRRFLTDCAIVDAHVPGHWVTEFGGIAGISYSLRQIALIQEIASDMRSACPSAWLLNTANPLPRVCQAAHEEGVRTAGFCAVSTGVYSQLWSIFEGHGLPYPFAAGRDRWRVHMGGVNHFSWLLGVWDRRTGESVSADLRTRIGAGHSSGNRHCESYVGSMGCMLLPNDRHVADFLEPVGPAPGRHVPQHGGPDERRQRVEMLRAVAEGRERAEKLVEQPSWERPVDFVAAMVTGREAHFDALDMSNAGQIGSLPGGVFVETPASVTPEGARPEVVNLPPAVVPLTRRTAEVTTQIVLAARKRSRADLHRAIEIDPTILDKRGGIAAIDDCLKAHADILPPFA